MAKSFFATLECELIEQESFSDRSEARLMVFICREGFYNPHRRHSAIRTTVTRLPQPKDHL
ncbi:hypothetical protein GGP46_003144 [Salinibacter ruber]|nr:hypothetical protein [Salinibacter ruber]